MDPIAVDGGADDATDCSECYGQWFWMLWAEAVSAVASVSKCCGRWFRVLWPVVPSVMISGSGCYGQRL
jgi:hypothetical protein